MKKIFIALGTVLFLSACTQFVKETAPVFPNYVAAPTVEQIDDDELDPDSEFTVKVTPGAGNIYYAFAIIPGTAAKDASALISNKYAGNAVKVKLIIEEVETEVPLSGSFAAAKQADTTVTAFKLKPNTAYTVYAVGAGENGALSAVTAHTIITTDSTLPSPFDGKKYSFSASDLEDGTFVVDFGDEVEFTEELQNGEAKFYATYYGANEFDEQYVLTPVFSAEIPVDSLSVSGSKVSIQVPERIPGAVVAISYDAGVVVNGVDLKNAALPADESGAYWTSKGLAFAGLAARFETKDWKFDLPMIENEDGKEVKMPADTIIYFSKIDEFAISATAQDLVEPLHQDAAFNAIYPQDYPEIQYTDPAGRKIQYPADEDKIGVQTDSVLVVGITERPVNGSAVALNLAKGAVEDLWGNPNAAFSTIYVDEEGDTFYGNYVFFSYGYTIDDVVGTYSADAKTVYAAYGVPDTKGAKVVVEASDDESKGNIKFTTFLDDICDYPIYANFDTDLGIISVPDSPYYDYVEYEWDDDDNVVIGEDGKPVVDDYGVLYIVGYGVEGVSFNVPKPGVIVLNASYGQFGVYGISKVSKDKSGFWDAYSSFTATRVEGESGDSGESSANPVRKKVRGKVFPRN